jgi:guanylate kinase
MVESHIQRRGLLLVLSSPSGAGKTTLSRRLLKEDGNLEMSVSVTTRKPRPGEVAGEDYHFITTEEFRELTVDHQLVEHAKVFDNYYGTPAQPVKDAMADGRDILFDIDWQGTQQLAEHMRHDMVSVFILPPSILELEQRLNSRAQDPADVVAGRMAKASDEMSHWPEYDYVILNDDVERAYDQLNSILAAERLKRFRQSGLSDFVKQLRDGL